MSVFLSSCCIVSFSCCAVACKPKPDNLEKKAVPLRRRLALSQLEPQRLLPRKEDAIGKCVTVAITARSITETAKNLLLVFNDTIGLDRRRCINEYGQDDEENASFMVLGFDLATSQTSSK